MERLLCTRHCSRPQGYSDKHSRPSGPSWNLQPAKIYFWVLSFKTNICHKTDKILEFCPDEKRMLYVICEVLRKEFSFSWICKVKPLNNHSFSFKYHIPSFLALRCLLLLLRLDFKVDSSSAGCRNRFFRFSGISRTHVSGWVLVRACLAQWLGHALPVRCSSTHVSASPPAAG